MNSLSFSTLSLDKANSSSGNDILQSASEALLKTLKPLAKSDVFQFGAHNNNSSSSAASSSAKPKLAALEELSNKNQSKKRANEMVPLDQLAYNMLKSDFDKDVFATKTVSAVAAGSFHPGSGASLSKKQKRKQVELMQSSRTKHIKQKKKIEKGKAYADRLGARLENQSRKKSRKI